MNKYAISDLHGRYDLYERVCGYLKPDDIVYADGHKYDIDLSSYSSGVTCLLDLDNLLPIYFEI